MNQVKQIYNEELSGAMCEIVFSCTEDHYMNFKVFKIIGYDCNTEEPVFDGEQNGKGKQFYISGILKWDGCINYVFNQELAMLHHCGIDDFESDLEIFKEIYKLGKEKIKAWSNKI